MGFEPMALSYQLFYFVLTEQWEKARKPLKILGNL